MRIVIGSRNTHKIREILEIAGALPEHSRIDWRSLGDYPDSPSVSEDGKTYAENARKKATELAKALGEWVLADDSGIEVDALGGRPGVLSSRYSGEPSDDERNNRKLLEELRGVAPEKRTARYRSWLVLASPDRKVLQAEGVCEGRIAERPAGKNGFGYDPLFYDPELGKTFGELEAAEKNRRSHRARALQALWPQLLAYLRST